MLMPLQVDTGGCVASLQSCDCAYPASAEAMDVTWKAHLSRFAAGGNRWMAAFSRCEGSRLESRLEMETWVSMATSVSKSSSCKASPRGLLWLMFERAIDRRLTLRWLTGSAKLIYTCRGSPAIKSIAETSANPFLPVKYYDMQDPCALKW